MRREQKRSAILLINFCKNMLLIALIVIATNECTTIDNTQNFWMQFCQFHLKKNEPSQEQNDPKQA